MKQTVGRLIVVHLAVLGLAAAGSAFVWGAPGALASLAGAFSFSLPVVLYSLLVLKASAQDPAKFWGRFMRAELLKWVTSGGLLAIAFAVGIFGAQPLLAGFLLSVLIQVFFPIFVRKESDS